jgi:hypothetical protein
MDSTFVLFRRSTGIILSSVTATADFLTITEVLCDSLWARSRKSKTRFGHDLVNRRARIAASPRLSDGGGCNRTRLHVSFASGEAYRKFQTPRP